jgi:parallel beta-helix repeat protein
MPTLSQIEPRHVIESLPFSITNSGPYVVTRNLTGVSGFSGITIQASSVTLDLNGFALQGVSGAIDGIAIDGNRSFVAIRNGVISGWEQDGINGATANNSKVEDLLVSNNNRHGVSLGTNSMILRSTANDNAAAGFSVGSDCIILESTTKGNGGTGFDTASGCVIQKCVADQNGNHGFSVEALGQITSCTASGNTTNGFHLQHNSCVLDSCAYGNREGFHGWDGIVFSRSVAYSNQYGFYAARNCSFSDCSAYANTYQGIYGDAACSIDNCSSYGNYDGIGASGGSKIGNSSACLNSGHGFWLGPATSVQGCSAVDNAYGITAQAGSYISDNELYNNSSAGISANRQCRIEDNHIVYCGTGILLTEDDNVLSGNILLSNGTDYDMSTSNRLDLIVSELPATISWPASVKLSGTLAGVDSRDGINITANNVSLDLGGHALVGVPGAFNGIAVTPGCANGSRSRRLSSHGPARRARCRLGTGRSQLRHHEL